MEINLNNITQDNYVKQREYSELLRDILTNDKELIAKHIRRILEKEDKTEFERRIAYTYFDNISLYNPIYSNIYKTKHKVSSVNLRNEDSSFANAINDYYVDGSLVDYIYNDLLEKLLFHTNGVIFVDYNEKEKLFENKFITEEYITSLELHKGNVEAITITTERGILHYKDNTAVELIKLDSKDIRVVNANINGKDKEIDFIDGFIYKIDGTKYVAEVRALSVNPFIFVGYKEENEVYKSFIDNLIPYAIHYASTTSEYQLTSIRHGYPKTAMIAPSCENNECVGGYVGVNQSDTCGTCKGTGQAPLSKSGYDVTLWTVEALQNDITGNQMKLDDIYKEFPSSLAYLTWQGEELERIKEASFNSIFYNTVKENNASNTQVSWRAVVMKKESENEALVPFANYLIKLSKKLIAVSSELAGNGKQFGQVVFYPKLVDLSISELTEIIKELRDLGADERLITYYENKLNESSFGLDSKEFIIKDIKSQLLPFKQLDEKQLILYSSTGLARQKDLFFYVNFDNIVNQIDSNEFVKGNEDKVKSLILAKLDEMYGEVNPITDNSRPNFDAEA